jgi:hypothetical protein
MRNAIAILILTGTLAACSVETQVAKETPAQLDTEDTNTLLTSYHATHDPEVKAAIIRRKLIPDQDWALIDSYQVAIGMYNFEVLAAWGDPDEVRTRTTEAGTKSRYTYDVCDGCKKSYLSFDTNGLLTTIVK